MGCLDAKGSVEMKVNVEKRVESAVKVLSVTKESKGLLGGSAGQDYQGGRVQW